MIDGGNRMRETCIILEQMDDEDPAIIYNGFLSSGLYWIQEDLSGKLEIIF